MSGYSAKLPITTDSNDGILLLKTIPQVAKQNFKNLLLTNPGERVWDAEYGVGLKKYLFENEQIVRQRLSNAINTQVKKYLPYITITQFNFNINEQQNIVGLQISFFVSGFSELNSLEI